MKILRNKTYQGMVDKEVKLRKENEYLKQRNKVNEETIALTKDDNMQLLNEIRQLKEEHKKQLDSSKGGYTKEINKLKKQVEELTFKLEESMSGKYVLKKIPSGRKPKGQPMKIKDCSRISSISRKVFSS